MEPQQNKAESVIAPLRKVTPLSKYLATVIFIAIPFIGGWIGYRYAPEKVIEIEKVVLKEVSVENEVSIDSTLESIDFSKCEPQLEKAAWEGQELVVVLGESLFDKRCHTLIYTASAIGDGGYKIKECWVPMGVGKISAEPSTMGGKTTNPSIPDEFCTTTVKQGTFRSEMNKKETLDS